MSLRADARLLYIGGLPLRGAWEGLASRQEEVVHFLPTPNSCISISHLVSFPFPLQIWVRKTSDSTKMRIYLGQLQRGLFVIRRRSAA